MLTKTGLGILYPENAASLIDIVVKDKKELTSPLVKTVPHKSWDLCKTELDKVFSFLAQYSSSDVFFLAPLHQSRPISDLETPYSVYTYEGSKEDKFEDCSIVEDDDLCSEEYSFEIILPYLEKLFPSSRTHAFFAPKPENTEEEKVLKKILGLIEKNYPGSIILISDNDDCCLMWKKALI